MIRITRTFVWALLLLTALFVFLGCDSSDDSTATPTPPPVGISGFPETLTMGVPFNLRENITVNLPDAPDKTFDDILWARSTTGSALSADTSVIEGDMFIPITFGDTTLYAIIDGAGVDGDGDDYIEQFQISVSFPLNPFIGTWSDTVNRVWAFNVNGTFGIDGAENVGSFVVWSGRPERQFLVTVAGNPDELTVETATAGGYKTYRFEVSGNTITITPIIFDYEAYNKSDSQSFYDVVYELPVILTRLSGEPAPLDITEGNNPDAAVMLGGWSGRFATTPFNADSDSITIGSNPTITYEADSRIIYGSYDGAWLKRGKVFVAVGNDGRRWDPPAVASWEKITVDAENAPMKDKDVVLIYEYRPGGAGAPYSRGTNGSLYWRLTKFPSAP
ncbi:MAG: hypothetical protein LBD73_03545 [Deferribacteraceae bacterium]|jgi:hypothetical protein|nr:hypothetical protein [Deferribacteraceae bacterium]